MPAVVKGEFSEGNQRFPLNSLTAECCYGDLRGMCFVLAEGVTGYVCGPLYQSKKLGGRGKQFEEGLSVLAYERKERLSQQVRRGNLVEGSERKGFGGGRRNFKSLAGAGKCKHTAQGIPILVRLCHAREGAREEVTLI